VRVRVKVGSRVRGLHLAGSFANQLWQALEGPHNRRGEVPTRDFHLRVELPVPFTSYHFKEAIVLPSRATNL
jgi:hypothetical protein